VLTRLTSYQLIGISLSDKNLTVILTAMDPQIRTYHDPEVDLQQPFDIAVVIPTLLRPSLSEAVRSIFAQDFNGKIHILIGVDHLGKTSFDFESLLSQRPKNMAVTLFWPGYSTNQAQGGMHKALGGGALRSILSFVANARYVAYLDDDNWFSSDHLSSLHDAIQGKQWAFSNRWFVTSTDHQIICEDTWESVGPNAGVFASNFDGFVDTNCLMIDMKACDIHLSNWCRPLDNSADGRGADRRLFSQLKTLTPYAHTHKATVSYRVQDSDSNHTTRLKYIDDHAIKTGPIACTGWTPPPKQTRKKIRKTKETGYLKLQGDHSKPFDITVVIPTLGRIELLKALHSIKKQDFKGRIQILIGIDKLNGDARMIKALGRDLPDHMGLMVFDPGYSTSKRHGGLHEAFDGGALRTILSYLAHAPYVAYLDDDNAWYPHHLSDLHKAIQNKHYAFSLRHFIHPDGKTPICTDIWESVGPNKGFYSNKFNGFVDPNCLMIDVQSCLKLVPLWARPIKGDAEAMSADRVIFHFLAQFAQAGSTNRVSVAYHLNDKDPMHSLRAMYLGHRWINADMVALKRRLLS